MTASDETQRQFALIEKQIQAVADKAQAAVEKAEEAAKIAADTHALVLELHLSLMVPPHGQDKSLLYQFAAMLEASKRHKWLFQIVIGLAGAVVTLAAAWGALKSNITGSGTQ